MFVHHLVWSVSLQCQVTSRISVQACLGAYVDTCMHACISVPGHHLKHSLLNPRCFCARVTVKAHDQGIKMLQGDLGHGCDCHGEVCCPESVTAAQQPAQVIGPASMQLRPQYYVTCNLQYLTCTIAMIPAGGMLCCLPPADCRHGSGPPTGVPGLSTRHNPAAH